MASNVDTRKLKDQASEFLGKSRFDKAAEILEQLVRAEPKEMQHRLKLGDTYRRLGSMEKSINCYQIAGRHFGDEGQLIKAIGAFKVILEIEPKNEMAQRDLTEMNSRRFAKPTLESAGLRVPKGIGAGARGISELELAESEKAAEGIGALIEGGRASMEMSSEGADDAPLELDMSSHAGRMQAPSAPAKPASSGSAPKTSPIATKPIAPAAKAPPQAERRGPPPKIRPSIDIGRTGELNPLGEPELELPEEELVPLDESLPAPTTPASAWRSGPIPPKGAPVVAAKPAPAATARPAPIIPPAPAAKTAPIAPPPASPSRRPPAAEPQEIELDTEELIELDPIEAPAPAPAKAAPASAAAKAPAPAAPAVIPPGAKASSSGRYTAAAQPIADLLAEGDGEEIELISISSDGPELAAIEPIEEESSAIVDGEEFDAAFTAIAPEPKPKPPPRKPAKVPLFDDLPQDAFLELVNRLSYKRWAKGEVILREGDPGRSFFVIVEGQVRVYKTLPDGKELTLATLGEGAFFGEMALLSGAPRAANCVADSETELLEISDQVLREIVGRFPSVAHSLKNFYRQRLVNNVMAISPMFKEFDPSERKSIVERFKMKQAAAGEVLIAEKQNADGLFVVLHGGVKVVKKLADGRDVELATLKEGELFGEMSLLTNEPATATVTASGPTILLKLPADQFQELILTHPQILELVSDLTDLRRTQINAVLQGHGPGHDGMSFV